MGVPRAALCSPMVSARPKPVIRTGVYSWRPSPVSSPSAPKTRPARPWPHPPGGGFAGADVLGQVRFPPCRACSRSPRSESRVELGAPGCDGPALRCAVGVGPGTQGPRGTGLVEELGDVVVAEAVDDAAAVAVAGDTAQGAQEAQLVGDGGLFHATTKASSPIGDGRCRRVVRIGRRDCVVSGLERRVDGAAVVRARRSCGRGASSGCWTSGTADTDGDAEDRDQGGQ